MIKTLQITAITVTAVFLIGVAGLILMEMTWCTKEPATPSEYFLFGSTGTELMPLPVFQVLPEIFPENFQPSGTAGGDWIDQFGFVRGQPNVNAGLPLGISVSNYRPKSGAPSPMPFIGFNCAVCHTAKIRRFEGDDGVLVLGMGSPNIDLVTFADAIKNSLLDSNRLTSAIIASTYQSRYHQTLGLFDRLFISLWLQETRAALQASLPMRNQPFGGADLRNPDLFPSGPGRNQPMKETVRFLINQTPMPDGGSSKIPCIYEQENRVWGQFDGAIGDPYTRNSLAALGVGASLENLRVPGILNTMHQAYQFVKNLDGPKYAEVFQGRTAPLDTASADRGREIYVQYCGDCHGSPGTQPGGWVKGSRQGTVIPVAELGTDPARVTFRYYENMADLIYNFFPVGHPLKPNRADLRPNPGDPPGFITTPLESVFSRAPYLHNGSVATLAELINLKPRRDISYRGANIYDVTNLGLLVSDQPDLKRYFRYDTQLYGNSNRGHDYPWAYHGPGWNEQALTDLLEYLKTL